MSDNSLGLAQQNSATVIERMATFTPESTPEGVRDSAFEQERCRRVRHPVPSRTAGFDAAGRSLPGLYPPPDQRR